MSNGTGTQPVIIALPCSYKSVCFPLRNFLLMSSSYLSPIQQQLLQLILILSLILSQLRCCHSHDDTNLLSATESAIVAVVADTIQRVTRNHHHNEVTASLWERHHIVCFQARFHHQQQQQQMNLPHELLQQLQDVREACCSDLTFSGLVPSIYDRKYCLQHIALIPTTIISYPSNAGNLVPVFYFAWDDDSNANDDDDDDEDDNEEENNHEYYDLSITERRKRNYYYKQKVYQFKEFKTNTQSYSPFHLRSTSSTTTTTCDDTPILSYPSTATSTKNIYQLRGYVEGRLSNEETGMHRSYCQRVHLILNTPHNDRDDDAKLPLSSRVPDTINLRVTVLLPISENVFIDADDPLRAYYGGDSSSIDGIYCKVSIGKFTASKFNTTSITRTTPVSSSSFSCNIQFQSPETIDIEQPSFASKQYVVAFEITSETMDPLVRENIISGNQVSMDLDYCSNIHIRYPPLIISNPDITVENDGRVPIIISQPFLYSASISIDDRLYSLQTVDAVDVLPAKSTDAILIRVPAGHYQDYWCVTVCTLLIALCGGVLLMKRLDTVSIWS